MSDHAAFVSTSSCVGSCIVVKHASRTRTLGSKSHAAVDVPNDQAKDISASTSDSSATWINFS